MESIEGILRKVLYHKPSRYSPAGIPFLIAALHNGTVVKGEMRNPVLGERYRFYGEHKPDRKHPDRESFEFSTHEAIIDGSDDGVAHYLAAHVDGVGKVKAAAIVEHFGGETLHVLRTEPGRVAEVPGIRPEVVSAITRHFEEDCEVDPAAYARLVEMFGDLRVPKRLITKLLADWGSDAPEKVRENPYMLLAYPRMSWENVDGFATAKVAYDPAGLDRHEAAILEAMERISGDGHTVAGKVDVEEIAYKLIGSRPLPSAWAALVGDVKLVEVPDFSGVDREYYALPKLDEAEREIARRLASLAVAARPMDLDHRIDGLNDDQQAAARLIIENGVCILAGAPGVGKAQPLDAPVLTPTGYRPMSEIETSDLVIGSDGRPCRVTGTFPQGILPIFRITCDDGSSVECCGEHLWKVRDRAGQRKWKIINTDQMFHSVLFTDGRPRWTLPMVDPVHFPESDLPIDPYLMGVMLGDGCFRGGIVSVCNPEPEIQQWVRELVPSGMHSVVANSDPITCYLRKGDSPTRLNPLIVSLKELGVYDHLSIEKFIPEVFLLSSVPDRISILQGLLDTDGSVSKCNIEYSTSSPRLARDVRFLVESLGGKVSTSSRIPKYQHKGESREGKLSFRILVKLPPFIQPFRLSRKAKDYRPRSKYLPCRRVVSVEPAGHKHCQCISIDSPDHLYVTDRFILTHNTYVVSRLLREIVDAGLFSSIKVCAPTGKAAKRAAEMLSDPRALGGRSSVVPCTTIHRALGPTPAESEEGVPADGARVGRGRDEFGFSHDEEDPIEVDLLICDESSMVDVRLAASLLAAIPLGTRIIFVGDPNQLPSVGPGAFLRDMIAAGIPTATLAKIQRSDAAGTVVHACHAIKDGRMPVPDGNFDLPVKNWVHIESSDPADIANTIVELHANVQAGRTREKLDPVWDMQVVSAQSGRHAFGCANLNALLSRQLNPPAVGSIDDVPIDPASAAQQEGEDRALPFRIADKVIRKKNGLADEMVPFGPAGDNPRPDWTWGDDPWSFRETPVVNGDMGTVLDIIPHDRGTWVVVKFRAPERLCRLSLAECHLIQAYAITCHSAQGSGFPYTIVPVHSSFFWDHKKSTGLWCRELVYTAISRAEKILVTVGELASIRTAIGRKTVDQRKTMLVERIRGAMAEEGDGDGNLVPVGPGGPDDGGLAEVEMERWTL